MKTADFRRFRARKLTPPMPLCKLADLPRLLPPGARLMGLDFGTRRIGIAVSDAALRVAAPVPLVRRRQFSSDDPTTAALVGSRTLRGSVAGLPLRLARTAGPGWKPTPPPVAELMRPMILHQ